MAQPSANLLIESIIEQASKQTNGLNDFGELPFLDPLQRALDSLEQEAQLHTAGRVQARDRMVAHTVNRLLYVEDRKKYPDISEQKIVNPIFIIGLPRTGTTILHDILAQDSDNRAPITWECMFPSPPPQRNTFKTDARIAQCQATFPDNHQPLDAMHPMGALRSQECVMLMCETMMTPLFHIQYRMPNYQDWLDTKAPLSSVYEFHHRQLQHFQWRCPGKRWVLKAWAHMWGLEHLLTQYPDARIIFTHRDPVKSLTSWASMTTHIRSLCSDMVLPDEIADDWSTRFHRVLNHTMDVRAQKISSDARIYDMHFLDLVSNPLLEIEKIYQTLDIPLTPDSMDKMKFFIRSNPRNKYGNHSYRTEDHGILVNETRDRFSRYINQFEIAPE